MSQSSQNAIEEPKYLEIGHLQATLFEPVRDEGKLLVIQPATGVLQGIYAKFAAFMAENGYTVFTYDYAGIGRSRPKSLKGFQCSATDWATRDAPMVLREATEMFPEHGLYVLGHSIGGQMIGLNEFKDKLDGVVHITTQSGYYGHWPMPKRLLLAANWYTLFPGLSHLFGYFPGKMLGAMEDLPKGVALDWAKWCRSSGYLFDHKPEADRIYANLDLKILAYSFSDDSYAPGDSVKWLLGKFSGSEIRHTHFDVEKEKLGKVGHFGFFRSRMKDKLWPRLIREMEEFL